MPILYLIAYKSNNFFQTNLRF